MEPAHVPNEARDGEDIDVQVEESASPPSLTSEPPRVAGPLSSLTPFEPSAREEREAARDANEERRVDEAGIRADMALLRTWAETYHPPGDQRDAALAWIDRHAPMLAGLAPYPVDSIGSSLRDFGLRHGACIRSGNIRWHCAAHFEAPAPRSDPPYTFTVEDDGVATLSITDLRDANAQGWEAFAATYGELQNARGLVLDLREAIGSDPRALWPLLRAMSGPGELKPLVAIERSPAFDEHVEAYRERFVSEERDPEAWRSFVGSGVQHPTAGPVLAIPTVVVVGSRCHAACELIARVLEANAGAAVIGSVSDAVGRLARDEPAVLTLPASGFDVFFFATTYRLAPHIETRTGPSAEWSSPSSTDTSHPDLLAAAHDVVRRRRRGEWPRSCDAFRPRRSASALRPAARAKVNNPGGLSHCREPGQPVIYLRSPLPHSLLSRLVSTCLGPDQPLYVSHNDSDRYFLQGVHRGGDGMRILTRLAQNPAITNVYVNCSRPDRLY